MIFSGLQSKMNKNGPLDGLSHAWFMAAVQNRLPQKQKKISALQQGSEHDNTMKE